MKLVIKQVKSILKIMVKNPGRTFLTVIGIIISIAFYSTSMVIIDSYIETEKQYYESFPENTALFNVNVLDRFWDTQTHEWAMIKNYKTYGSTYDDFQDAKKKMDLVITGVDEDFLYFPVRSVKYNNTLEVPKLIAGRSIQESDVVLGTKVVLMNRSYCDLLFGKNKGLYETLTIENDEYQIVGILDDTVDVVDNSNKISNGKSLKMNIYMAGTTANKHFSVLDNYTIVRFDEYNYFDKLDILESNYGTAFTRQYIMEICDNNLKDLKQIFTVIMIALSIFSGIVVLITMLFSVKERTYEIGVKRALGATKNDITFSFIVEALIYSLIGIVIGLIISIVISVFVHFTILSMNPNAVFSISTTSILLPVIVGLTISTVFGIIPAIIASRTNIVKCLKVD